jgi:spectinomycin phosphotransferase/16S rRNA (guanine(1405)-N(7))-methyltransferase
MLTRPPGLSDDALARALAAGWCVEVASMRYRSVGFGSHHWEIVDQHATRWFVTVDELELKRASLQEPVAEALDRLRAALRTTRDLYDAGYAFVVAPVLTFAGEPLLAIDGRFAAALYPFVEGERFDFGTFSTDAHRLAVLDLIIQVHTAGLDVSQHARLDDFEIPRREELEASIRPTGRAPESGPYGEAASALLAGNRPRIERALERYDELVRRARETPEPMVLTHGEPHPGNTIATVDGWRLVDWDTVLVAPRERDLWDLDPGDGSIIDSYRAATGILPKSQMVELFGVRWDLSDMAVYARRFRAPHSGSRDDEKSWDDLCALVEHLPA